MLAFWRELFVDRYPRIDNTRVELYLSDQFAAQHWTAAQLPKHQPLPSADQPRPPVSVVATVRNEADNIAAWMQALLHQTRLPDEIVIVDGGSTDGTFEILQKLAAEAIVPVQVWQTPGANIAQGRNRAIERAQGPIIACTDAGCRVPADWVAKITAPFAADPSIEVVAGYYDVVERNEWEKTVAAYFVAPAEKVDVQMFLPATRSVAFQKTAWSEVGGFAEWLTLTAEDTLFDLMLKRRNVRWAFVPEAVVSWYVKPALPLLFRQVRTYAEGDGEVGIFPAEYRKRMQLVVSLHLAALLAILASMLGVILHSWLWFGVALAPALWLARRFHQITVRPAWAHTLSQKARVFVTSALVIYTITLAMAIGFVRGARRRRELPLLPPHLRNTPNAPTVL